MADEIVLVQPLHDDDDGATALVIEPAVESVHEPLVAGLPLRLGVIVETWSDRRCWLIEPVSLCLQAAMSFSFASGIASRKVCIGVLPKHQRPGWGRCSLYSAIQASRSVCSSSIVR